MPSEPSANPVILNNTPLVALWSIDHLWVLKELYTEVAIPQAVQDEFLATETSARQGTLTQSPWINTISISNPRQALIYVGLDQGEAEVLALAVEKSASLVIIDEQKGRRYARRMGIPLTGTIGVLLAAKRQGLIPQISPLIDQLLNEGLYLSPALVNKALILAEEK